MYTSLPQTCRLRQISSSKLASPPFPGVKYHRGTRTVYVQFSLPAKTGMGWDVMAYFFSLEASPAGGSEREVV